MKAASLVPGILVSVVALAAATVPSRADPPLAGSRLFATAPAQVFCSSPYELAAYTAATIRHDPIGPGLFRGCTAVIRGTPVQVLEDLGPSGHLFHVVRAVAAQGFPLRPVNAYTYSVGLGPARYDSSLPPYRAFP